MYSNVLIYRKHEVHTLLFYNKKTVVKIKRRHCLPIVWLLFIIYASLAPAQNLPKIYPFPEFDKLVHFGIYYILSILLVAATLNNKKYVRSYYIAFIIALLIGLLFEFLQELVTSKRTGSIYDELANTTGALIGVISYHIFIRKKKIEKFIFKIQ